MVKRQRTVLGGNRRKNSKNRLHPLACFVSPYVAMAITRRHAVAGGATIGPTMRHAERRRRAFLVRVDLLSARGFLKLMLHTLRGNASSITRIPRCEEERGAFECFRTCLPRKVLHGSSSAGGFSAGGLEGGGTYTIGCSRSRWYRTVS